MSKKKLLEESTVRSFMKLANLQPLSEKFISETWKEGAGEEEEKDEEELDEAKKEEEEGVVEEAGETRAVTMPAERDPPADRLTEEAEEAEEGKVTEEGKESEGRPAAPKQKVKGVAKPAKMDAAKNALPDAKLKPMKQTSNHSVKSGNVKVGDETGPKSNATKKNNSQFEMMTENLEEVELEEDMEEVAADAAPEAEMTPSDAAGEGEEHQATVKDALKKMLDAMQQIASEYGVDMSVSSDEEAAGAEEAPEMAGAEEEGGEEDEAMMETSHKEEEMKMHEDKLEEMLDKLTKRVAARLVRESSKKKR